MSNFEARVLKGIRFLDSNKPGWRDSIEIEMLDLSDISECVLGQVFGSYEEGVYSFGISSAQVDDFLEVQSSYGFDLTHDELADDCVKHYESLTQEWVKQICQGAGNS